jgi:hypothetical protein
MKEIWGKFHHHFTCSFCTSRFTPILLANYFLVGRNGEVGHNFVGETELRLLASKNDYWCVCTLRQNVDEIDPSTTNIAGPLIVFLNLYI